MDNLTKKQRSLCMSNIKSRNTKAEIIFRKYIFDKGLRGYRVNSTVLGKPDIFFPKKKIAVFIDGCFWHKCPKCFVKPKSGIVYWQKKIENNVSRDKKINKELRQQGFQVLRFWEHSILKQTQKCFDKLIKVYEK